MFYFLFIFMVQIGHCSESKTLSVNEVLKSTQIHYPLILESIQNIEASKMKLRQAFGAFDFNFSVKSDNRIKGYYDGRSTDIKIEKPLKYLNAKVYTGYRKSNGSYPTYEGKFNTLEGGETRVGASFSILRNRSIDIKRLKLRNGEIDISLKEFKALIVDLKVQKIAFKSYWEWVARGKILKVNEGLLNIAEKRMGALRKRVNKGDLARIYLTENNQYIAKRRTEVQKALQMFYDAGLKLSLFIRDKNGNPFLASNKMIPKSINSVRKLSKGALDIALSQTNKLNPKLVSLQLKKQEIENNISLAKNDLSPTLDINFEMSRDSGFGSKTLKENESRAMVLFEIPLERNAAKGKLYESRARKMALNYRMKLANEELTIKIKNLYNMINTSVDITRNTKKEVQYAGELEKAEVKKFFRGASDFFIVNLREQNSADAKIKNYKELLKYFKSLADYKEATLDFIL